MVKTLRLVAVIGLMLAGLGLALWAALPPARAHEGREVADGAYTVVFGWRIEPTYTGLFNGPEFTVERNETRTPVSGLEDSLQIEVLFGGRSKLLRLRGTGEAGHYTADLIPTRPGDYSFRIFGMIDDTPIDETFSSVDGEFDTVNPIEDIQFP